MPTLDEINKSAERARVQKVAARLGERAAPLWATGEQMCVALALGLAGTDPRAETPDSAHELRYAAIAAIATGDVAPLLERMAEHFRFCRECGCTEADACLDASGVPCSWLDDDLCSACPDADPEP